MANAAPHAIGIRAARTDRQTISGHAGKQRLAAAVMRAEPELRDSNMSTRSITPRLADFSVITVEKLCFADTDRQGHITNTVLAVCCQNARTGFLCDPRRVPIPCNTQFVIAKLVLEFRAEMHWPGTVAIGTRVERIGRASVTLARAFFMAQRYVANAESIVALMDTMTRRSLLLPHDTTEALRQIRRPNCGWVTDAIALILCGAKSLSRLSAVAKGIYDQGPAIALYASLYPDDRWMIGSRMLGPNGPPFQFAILPPYVDGEEAGPPTKPIIETCHQLLGAAIVIGALERRGQVPLRPADRASAKETVPA